MEQALKAIEYPNVASVQIIFNIVRQRPAERFFAEAQRRDVGILARVPLASGLLTGKLTRDSTFAADDHRLYNRDGGSFDKGETFAGLDYETGLALVEELRGLVPEGATLAQTGAALDPDARRGHASPSPAPARPSRHAPTRPPRTSRRCRRPRWRASVSCTSAYAKPLVHQRW